MKKLFLIAIVTITLTGCFKEDLVNPIVNVTPDLKIESTAGIKLASSFVTDEVSMNVKLESAGTINVKILDISNRVVSKETMNVSAGDNILKVYTRALPSSAYRIALYNSNNVLIGITDFNKL
jgi:hypothetical protein